MKSIFNRAVSLIMGTVLIFSMTGCGKKADEQNEGTKAGNNNGAMGRYMENEIKLPEISESTLVSNMSQDNEGNIVVNAAGKDGVIRYTCKENEWNEEKLPYSDNVLEVYGEGFSMNNLIERDNYTYISGRGYEEDSSFSKLTKIDKDNNVTVVELEGLDEYEEIEGYKLYKELGCVQILDDGRIIAGIDGDSIVLFNENGKKEKEFNNQEGNSFVVKDDILYASSTDGSKMSIFDLTSGKLIDEFEMFSGEVKTNSYNVSAVAMSIEGDDIYLLNDKGVHKLGKDNTIVETIIDGSLNSLNRQDINKYDLIKSDEKFYVLAGSSGSYYVFEYAFDENVSAVPEKELSVYSLYDNATVRQAMSEFQKNNTDVRVNYRVAINDEWNQENTDTQDYIKALNTELLAGKGADVIILDGLETQTYIEKGVLTDISGVIKDMGDELLTNVTDAYKDDKGNIYSVPSKVGIPIAVGNKDLLAAYCELDKLCDYIEQNKDKNVICRESMDSLLEYCYMLYQNNILSGKRLDEAALTEMLERIKRLYETAASNDQIIDETNGEAVSAAASLYKSEYAVSREELTSFMDLMFITGAFNENSSFSGINNIFIPLGQIGVNSSGQVDLSNEFVKVMLSESVQSAELNNGFPVNLKALEAGAEKESEMIGGVSMDIDGEFVDFNVSWPDKGMRTKVADIVKSVNVPYENNRTIYDMVRAEVVTYLEQGESADEAAAKIIEAAKVYLAE